MTFQNLPMVKKCLATTMAVLITTNSYAQESDDGFAGEGGGSSGGSAPVSELFDNSENFVPLAELPVQDVYVKEGLTAAETEADVREALTAISVTPDGVVEELPANDETVAAMMEIIAGIDDGSLESAADGSDNGSNEEASAFAGQSESAESVIGADTRVQINGTTSYPFRTAGRIGIGCTGTLVGKRHVLTAGHCVYNIRSKRWYSNLKFSPGQRNATTRPYGEIDWKRAVSVKGWTKDGKRNYDYAMIILKEDIGNRVGWMGYGWKSPMPKYNVNINGYPGDKPTGTMWHSFCKMSIITKYRLYYPCDTAGGMSGSGVYVYFTNPTKRTIYGIHAYGVDGTGYNGATRIRKPVFENIKKWKSQY